MSDILLNLKSLNFSLHSIYLHIPQVLYIDYGNRASVPKTKLGSLPATFQTPGGYAKPYSLALTMLPPDEDLTAQAVAGLKEDVLDKTVKLNVEYK